MHNFCAGPNAVNLNLAAGHSNRAAQSEAVNQGDLPYFVSSRTSPGTETPLPLFQLGKGRFQPILCERIKPFRQKPGVLSDLLFKIFALFAHGLTALEWAGASALSYIDSGQDQGDDSPNLPRHSRFLTLIWVTVIGRVCPVLEVRRGVGPARYVGARRPELSHR